ncbi:large subunit ribosomal protein L19e [Nematocida major]|uniref:large subunit ribosomal protein L19e n=1 Tax=Nematocida major TaxID=1912982 RepID=UPI0020085661|nr:large subunit ribosomal protein L19e [Nematocida major]KAH9386144.1 large subunit ribosomal protein L19e [Nematocida major]
MAEKKEKAKNLGLVKVRAIAAKVIGCGRNKVWMDPTESVKLSEGKTPEQVSQMVQDGLIVRRPDVGQSRGRVRQFRLERSLGRHRGLGRRRGTKNARFPQRKIWMMRIRAVRKDLKELREEGRIDRKMYRAIYLKAKGGYFKNRRMLKEYVVNEELRKKKEEMVSMTQAGL